jgi:hypothetical protein
MNARGRIGISVSSFLTFLSIMPLCQGQCPAKNDKSAKCGTPVVLEVLPGGKYGPEYRLEGKLFDGYPLTQVANQVYLCTDQRPLHVIVDSRVPAGEILGSAPSKLQANNIRYFIRYPAPDHHHVVVEVKFGEFSSLP